MILQISIFYELIDKVEEIELPSKWFKDVSVNEFDKKLTISFFKLGKYNTKYQRSIEKELIITQGQYTLIT